MASEYGKNKWISRNGHHDHSSSFSGNGRGGVSSGSNYTRQAKPYRTFKKKHTAKIVELPEEDYGENKFTPPSSSSLQNFRNAQCGDCLGCGKPNSKMRFVTREFLCDSCRKDVDYKLITKTTVLTTYPILNIEDLMSECKNKTLQIFFVNNWHDSTKAPIKLYYEKEITALAEQKRQEEHLKKQPTAAAASSSTSHSKPKKSRSKIIEF